LGDYQAFYSYQNRAFIGKNEGKCFGGTKGTKGTKATLIFTAPTFNLG
jgi:hypothetical protein